MHICKRVFLLPFVYSILLCYPSIFFYCSKKRLLSILCIKCMTFVINILLLILSQTLHINLFLFWFDLKILELFIIKCITFFHCYISYLIYNCVINDGNSGHSRDDTRWPLTLMTPTDLVFLPVVTGWYFYYHMRFLWCKTFFPSVHSMSPLFIRIS